MLDNLKRKIQGLYFIVNTYDSPPHNYLWLAEQAINGGADCIQFRHKGTYLREHYKLAADLAELCSKFDVPFLVNDRVDVALSVEASGVHLGQTDMPLSDARKLIGENKILGATCYSLEQAKRAQHEGADYIGLGHIFPTTTKIKIEPPIGTDRLSVICKEITIPLIAIGGIKIDNADRVCAARVDGIAIVTGISDHKNPAQQTKIFKEIFAKYAVSSIC